MPCVDVIGDVHSNLAALGSERSRMPPFNLRMLQGIGCFFRIVTYLRSGGVVHHGE